MGKPKFTTNKVSSLLHSGKQLSHLGRMLEKQHALLQMVRSQLPSPLDQHCLHARISGKLLIIHTDSSAWSTRLRFHGPQLIRALKREAPRLQQLKVNIHIDLADKATKRRQIILSKHGATQILDAADSVDDPELRAALRRLGSSGDKNRN